MKKYLKKMMAFVVVSLMILSSVTAANAASGVKIHVISVDAADSILIEYNGHYMLIDAGYATQNDRSQGEALATAIDQEFDDFNGVPTDATEKKAFITKLKELFAADMKDDGGNDCVNYLKKLGVKTIDYVISTHPHWDHCGGLASVAVNFDVKHFLWSNSTHTSSYYKIFQALVADKCEEVSDDPVTSGIPKENSQITLGGEGGPVFTLLTDTTKEYTSESQTTNTNNYSLVYRMDYNNRSALFTGDIERLGQQDIMADHYSQLNCDIYKVAHHGNSNNGYYYLDSTKSGNYEFVQAINPTISLVSCGYKNLNIAQPTRKCQYDLRYSDLYLTKTQGTLICSIVGNDVSVTNTDGTTLSPDIAKHRYYSSSLSGMSWHYASTPISYKKLTYKDVTVSTDSSYDTSKIFYKLVANDAGFVDDGWTQGNAVTINTTFRGTVYFKTYDKLGNAEIRKSDGIDINKNITVSTPKIKSAKAKKKKIIVKATKSSGATGYEYSYRKLGSAKWTAKSGSVAKTIASLLRRKYYYVRVRAYKTVDGMKFYSHWSKSKKVRVK